MYVADYVGQRKKNGEALYMLVGKVLLGDMYLAPEPLPFKRPPCTK